MMSNELPLDIQRQTIKAILEKVTRFNLCLICNVQFPSEAAAEHHYLNVHHAGTFACEVFGCNKVEKTNGDLRMHHCLWHSDTMSSQNSLPQNPMIAKYYSEDRKPLAIAGGSSMSIDCIVPTVPSLCVGCDRHLFTDLGTKLHHESHYKYNTFMGYYEKMTDIKSERQLVNILNGLNGQGQYKNIPDSMRNKQERRQSKVSWDLMNNKVYEVNGDQCENYVTPPPSPDLSPIYISSDEEFESRLNEMRVPKSGSKKSDSKSKKRARTQSMQHQKKERKNGRRHSSHHSCGC